VQADPRTHRPSRRRVAGPPRAATRTGCATRSGTTVTTQRGHVDPTTGRRWPSSWWSRCAADVDGAGACPPLAGQAPSQSTLRATGTARTAAADAQHSGSPSAPRTSAFTIAGRARGSCTGVVHGGSGTGGRARGVVRGGRARKWLPQRRFPRTGERPGCPTSSGRLTSHPIGSPRTPSVGCAVASRVRSRVQGCAVASRGAQTHQGCADAWGPPGRRYGLVRRVVRHLGARRSCAETVAPAALSAHGSAAGRGGRAERAAGQRPGEL